MNAGLDILLEFIFYDNPLLKEGCLQPPCFDYFTNDLFGSGNLNISCNKKNTVMNAGLDIMLEFNFFLISIIEGRLLTTPFTYRYSTEVVLIILQIHSNISRCHSI